MLIVALWIKYLTWQNLRAVYLNASFPALFFPIFLCLSLLLGTLTLDGWQRSNNQSDTEHPTNVDDDVQKMYALCGWPEDLFETNRKHQIVNHSDSVRFTLFNPNPESFNIYIYYNVISLSEVALTHTAFYQLENLFESSFGLVIWSLQDEHSHSSYTYTVFVAVFSVWLYVYVCGFFSFVCLLFNFIHLLYVFVVSETKKAL